MACRISFLKALLIILNVLLAIIGVALIALSVYELNNSTPGTFGHIAVIVQIFVGSFVVLTSFLGCFATGRLSLGLIWSFVICIVILICLQLYIITAAHFTDYVERARADFVQLWSVPKDNIDRIAYIEQKYKCCGKDGSHDYILMGSAIPVNCYENMERSANNLFRENCLKAVQLHATDNVVNGLILKWVLLVVELASLGVASYLGITVRNKLRRENY